MRRVYILFVSIQEKGGLYLSETPVILRGKPAFL